jgi:hypothetical protein
MTIDFGHDYSLRGKPVNILVHPQYYFSIAALARSEMLYSNTATCNSERELSCEKLHLL